MLPLNHWNKLSHHTRVHIASIIYECDILNTSAHTDLAYEYHHNFDHDKLGQKLKRLLSHLNLQKDGTINITLNITPTYTTPQRDRHWSPPIPVEPKRIPCASPQPTHHYLITYLDASGDSTNIHLYAASPEEAKQKAHSEYWDIQDIINIQIID